MEIFFAEKTEGNLVFLNGQESAHCVRVLRHRPGDPVTVVDGCGNKYDCILEDADPRGATARIVSEEAGWNAHPYRLCMAVCPTKNNDRYEWFAEKATETGVDTIVPVIGERSERRVFKTERLEKVVLSAMKQSLKAALPVVEEPVSVSDFIRAHAGEVGVKMICYCFEDDGPRRRSVREVLADAPAGAQITVLIGPEGDFSPQEARLAVEAGFVPVHLGASRLRTETAAVVAATACYLHFMDNSQEAYAEERH